MFVLEGIIAGILAGTLMGLASDIGYRTGMIRSNLVVIDGSFAAKFIKEGAQKIEIYILGIFIHLITSAIFGAAYIILARLFDFNAISILALFLYVLLLWLSMLFLALPAAGQGIMGRKIGQNVWLEQLVLHLLFGIAFWWALVVI